MGKRVSESRLLGVRFRTIECATPDYSRVMCNVPLSVQVDWLGTEDRPPVVAIETASNAVPLPSFEWPSEETAIMVGGEGVGIKRAIIQALRPGTWFYQALSVSVRSPLYGSGCLDPPVHFNCHRPHPHPSQTDESLPFESTVTPKVTSYATQTPTLPQGLTRRSLYPWSARTRR